MIGVFDVKGGENSMWYVESYDVTSGTAAGYYDTYTQAVEAVKKALGSGKAIRIMPLDKATARQLQSFLDLRSDFDPT